MRIPIALCTIVMSMTVLAQGQQSAGGDAATQERVAALKQALAANQAALKQYTWTETTDISLKGEVKKREQKSCRYGADGKVQKTPIGGEETPQSSQKEDSRGGRRRGGQVAKKAIVAHKVGDIKDYMEQVAALVHEYVPPDKDKIQSAAAAGHVSMQPNPSSGMAALSVQDYLKPGDSLVVGLDLKANALTTYDVRSYVDDPKEDVVTLAVRFDRLADGTSYPQQTVLDAAAKQIQVKVTNSRYARGQ